MSFIEDLDEFLGIDDFGVEAVYVSASTGALKKIIGIFDKQYFEPMGGTVEDSTPSFLCKASDVPILTQGDSFTINGDRYESCGNEPARTGLVRVRLAKQ